MADVVGPGELSIKMKVDVSEAKGNLGELDRAFEKTTSQASRSASAMGTTFRQAGVAAGGAALSVAGGFLGPMQEQIESVGVESLRAAGRRAVRGGFVGQSFLAQQALLGAGARTAAMLGPAAAQLPDATLEHILGVNLKLEQMQVSGQDRIQALMDRKLFNPQLVATYTAERAALAGIQQIPFIGPAVSYLVR